jgi:hypothetical protein
LVKQSISVLPIRGVDIDLSVHTQVSPISGGISNMTVKFTPKNAALAPIAVKVFGDKTEVLVKRDKERQSLVSLNAMGFGAQVGPPSAQHILPIP